MNKIRQSVACLIAGILLVVAGCHTNQPNKEDLSTRCCQECREAFSQSPVGVGAGGAQCGEFTTAKPISSPCSEYFKAHPMTVAECE